MNHSSTNRRSWLATAGAWIGLGFAAGSAPPTEARPFKTRGADPDFRRRVADEDSRRQELRELIAQWNEAIEEAADQLEICGGESEAHAALEARCQEIYQRVRSAFDSFRVEPFWRVYTESQDAPEWETNDNLTVLKLDGWLYLPWSGCQRIAPREILDLDAIGCGSETR